MGYGFLAIHRSFATSRHYPLNILTESLIFSCWYQVFYFHMAADWFLTISELPTIGLGPTYCQPLLALITFSNDQIHQMPAKYTCIFHPIFIISTVSFFSLFVMMIQRFHALTRTERKYCHSVNPEIQASEIIWTGACLHVQNTFVVCGWVIFYFLKLMNTYNQHIKSVTLQFRYFPK